MGRPFRFIRGHSGASEGKGPNRFKLRRGTAVIFLERQKLGGSRMPGIPKTFWQSKETSLVRR
jgi:hypothetical protein